MNTLPDTLPALYQALRENLKTLGNPDLEARLILKNRAGVEWAEILAQAPRRFDPQTVNAIANDIKRRKAHEPLSRIYGTREFYGLEFALSPATLDPRPETELLVDRALKIFESSPPSKILDLGTGTGCLIITLLTQWKSARGVAVDREPAALTTARRNAAAHNVADRITWACGSWLASLQGRFDLIVSNPPYIARDVIPTLMPEVGNHDPILALDGGEDGLQAYKEIFAGLKSALNEEGIALFEIGWDQQENVVRLAEESGLSVEGVIHDYAGQPRVVEISCGDK